MCDNCPYVGNPGQGQVAFPTILAPASNRFEWGAEVDYLRVSGSLHDVATYSETSEITGVGSYFTFQQGPFGPADLFYLLRFQDATCGTYGSAARDAALP